MSSPSLSLSPTPPLSPAPQAAGEPVDEDFQDPPAAPATNPSADMDNDLSDAESVLSDVDEAQFEDFDPNQITIEERPAIAIDEDNLKAIGRHKRKRLDGEVDAEGKKKKKEGRREKVKKSKKRKDSDDEFSGGEQMQGKRIRKKKAYIEGEEGARPRKEKAKPRQPSPEVEENLDPEESTFEISVSVIERREINGRLKLYRTSTCSGQSNGPRSQEPYQAPPEGRRSCEFYHSILLSLTIPDFATNVPKRT